MNIDFFRECIDYASYCGQTLTPEQKIIIENSLIILQNENKFKDVFFWGRINGTDKDYFIAFGYTIDCLIERKFFYSVNCYEWLLMPAPDMKNIEACILCEEKFVGDPSVLTIVQLDPKFTIDENQIILATEPEVIKIKEEDRLSCLVNLITEESAIIPRGGLFKMIDKSSVYNPMFAGLSDIEASEVINYQLYRVPQNDLNYNLLKRVDYNYPTDFLDTIDDIIPQESSFSIVFENNMRLVNIKSCIWPGMVFFHKLKTNKHGFVYYGDGKKNLDLLFMM